MKTPALDALKPWPPSECAKWKGSGMRFYEHAEMRAAVDKDIFAATNEAMFHLGAALAQSIDKDDQIIMQHVRDAYVLLGGKLEWHSSQTAYCGPTSAAEFAAEVKAVPVGWMGNANGLGCDPDVGGPEGGTPAPTLCPVCQGYPCNCTELCAECGHVVHHATCVLCNCEGDAESKAQALGPEGRE